MLIDDAQSAGVSLARLVGVADRPGPEAAETEQPTKAEQPEATVATEQPRARPRGSAVPRRGR